MKRLVIDLHSTSTSDNIQGDPKINIFDKLVIHEIMQVKKDSHTWNDVGVYEMYDFYAGWLL